MSLQADIQWIKTELDYVKDPDLIEAFKRLLSFRKSKTEDSFFTTTTSDLQHRAEESLKSIGLGETRSLLSFKKEIDNWKKSQNTK
jgi:hypothetical protein